MQTQYFSRGLKSLVLRHGPPSYDEFDSLFSGEENARVALYSPDGSAFAYSTQEGTKVLDPDTRQEICRIADAALDMYFSPLGSFLVTWTRAKRDADSGNWVDNLKVWNAKTGEFQASFLQKTQGSFRGGWQVQFTADEKFCVQQTGPKTLVVTEANLGTSIQNRIGSLTIPSGIEDFSVSPGLNPAVSVFAASHGGKPASIRVYKLPSLNHPVAQRTLFRAESVLAQWNKLGTALLVVAQTDVDSSNKSYYGESTLYLLSVNSGSDQRIMLDREGPVYDVAWSPDSDEFGVVYGLMPAQTSFFNVRGQETTRLPLAPRNHIKYSPQSRFVVVAGFGNLQGHMDIYDRSQAMKKVGEILATNSSFYDWSPCGRVILTATTSPRLRVDNGIKLWNYEGQLLYQHDNTELYAVGWRPQSTALDLRQPAPQPHVSALEKPAPKPASTAKGAYVPPHARKAGDAPRPVRSLYDATETSKPKQKKPLPQPQQPHTTLVAAQPSPKPEEKQIRSLVKKLRAIDDLKQRQANGEPLEVTQTQKIYTEREVLEKLKGLGWTAEEF